MGEIVTLTDDIDGPSVTADERVKFTVDGRDYEIDLTTEHADKLRGEFAGLTELVRVRVGIGGQTHDVHLPADTAREFRAAMEYWTEHARRSGTPAKRVKHGTAAAPTAPVIKPGERYWETPHGVTYGSKAGDAWRDLRMEIKVWGQEHGYTTGQRGVIPDSLGLAFAQWKLGMPYAEGADAVATPDADEAEDALMPEPEPTTTRKRTTRNRKTSK